MYRRFTVIFHRIEVTCNIITVTNCRIAVRRDIILSWSLSATYSKLVDYLILSQSTKVTVSGGVGLVCIIFKGVLIF